MRIIFNPKSNLKLLQYGIQIPVTDFRDELISRAMHDSKIEVETIGTSLSQISNDDLCRVHEEKYITRLQSPLTLIHEVMSCFELINPDGSYHRYKPETAVAEMTELYDCVVQKIETVYYAANYCLQGENAFVLGGGFHHAMSFGGRGFCLLNDIVIVLEKLRYEKKITSAWIIDVDAHKGDGCAELTKDNKQISTLSIHMKSQWPLDSASHDLNNNLYPWFIPSTIDIPLEKGEESIYLQSLAQGLESLEKLHPQPNMAIVVLGADPYEKDELPSAAGINLTLEQMLERDLLVHRFLQKHHIPALYVMGGGYGVHSQEPYIQFLKNLILEKK